MSAAPARRDSATAAGAGTGGVGIGQGLSAELQQYQVLSVKLKEKVGDLRRRKGVSVEERTELDAQISDIQALETRIRNQLESQTKQLDQLPRAEIAKSRIALVKLTKDFERVKATADLTISEAAAVKVDLNSKSNAGSSLDQKDTVFQMGNQSNSPSKPKAMMKGGELQFENQLQGQAVDDLIAEERERDILKMNQDLRLVNEMFKDMAQIVEKQQPAIEQVAVAAEASHERAKAGLEQVQQAAAHQGGGCFIS